jgi:hypothetical protein
MSKRAFTKAVVIPVYKDNVDKFEEISLDRCFAVLGEYPVCLVTPEGLSIQTYQKVADRYGVRLNVESFEAKYFQGIEGYNRLMLSRSFYDRFSAFDRILLYQTDCFVFNDQFEYWCKYDYVGAPWVYRDNIRNFYRDKLKLDIKRLLKPIVENRMGTILYKSGNGGFSIRNPRLFVEIIDRFGQEGIMNIYGGDGSSKSYYNEDVFWSIEVNRHGKHLKIPGFKKALRFSIDTSPSICYQLNQQVLPFGCHAYRRYEPDFWKPFIEQYGYKLD